MNKVYDHYKNHLGDFYSWMSGGFLQNKLLFKEYFDSQNIENKYKKAIDLGAGNGAQASILIEYGYKTTAIDFNDQLLDELKENINSDNLNIINDDLLNFDAYYEDKVDLILCMGDTITHLTDLIQIKTLFEKVYHALEHNGSFILSFRDYENELQYENRFILVKQDVNKIHNCFLEYYDTHVRVYDILNYFIDNEWKQKISYYDKVRLSVNQVKNLLINTGFKIDTEKINRMNYIHVKK